ncbi:uncharacterized protein LOC109400123 [Aedes albopictus]|uniref:C2H2-type domain-containing protein n=1 Tax=Aedes albopictus TaxID=7160 RepID=A0ABM1XRP1_AEDAL
MDDNAPKIHTIKPYSKDNISSCLDDIKTGRMTCYLASKRYGIPVSTLRYRLSARWKKSITPGPSTILTATEEQEIVDWLQDMQSRGFFMTRAECVSKVSHYMKWVGREAAFKNAQPGRRWCELFLRRNTNFALSKVTTTLTAEYIRNWFRAVKQRFVTNNHLEVLEQPARIFMVEEVFLYFPGKARTMADIAVMFGFGASGSIVHPNILVSTDRAPHDFKMLDLPPGWGVKVSERGCLDTQTFRSYILAVFHPYLVQQGVRLPVVLFVDGHALSQIAEIDDLCQSLGIILVSLYNSSNINAVKQPTSWGISNVVRTKWQKALNIWRSDKQKPMLTLPYFGIILQRTMEQEGSIYSEIRNAFLSSGLYPFNTEAIDYSKFPTSTTAEILTPPDESMSTDLLDGLPGYSEPPLDESVSSDPLDDVSGSFEPAKQSEQESEPVASEQVSISIDRIYEAYDLIDSHTRTRIRGDIRSLTREERIIRFFYREFIQPNVHFNDSPLEESAVAKGELQLGEMMVVKSEPPDFDCGNEESDQVASSLDAAPVMKETVPETQINVDTVAEQLNAETEPPSKDATVTETQINANTFVTQSNQETEPPFKDASMFCRMCGNPHRTSQRFNNKDIQSEPKMSAVLQLCFVNYEALHSVESVCAACYREISVFRVFLQNCHEGQRRLNGKLKQIPDSNTEPSNQLQSMTIRVQTWQCEKCEKAYDTKLELHQHVVNDHGEVYYTCDICQAVLKTKNTLYQHRRMLHGELKRCDYCSKRFSTDKKYEKHLQEVHLLVQMGDATAGVVGQPPNGSYIQGGTNPDGAGQVYGSISSGTSMNSCSPSVIKYEQHEYGEEGGFSGNMQ